MRSLLFSIGAIAPCNVLSNLFYGDYCSFSWIFDVRTTSEIWNFDWVIQFVSTCASWGKALDSVLQQMFHPALASVKQCFHPGRSPLQPWSWLLVSFLRMFFHFGEKEVISTVMHPAFNWSVDTIHDEHLVWIFKLPLLFNSESHPQPVRQRQGYESLPVDGCFTSMKHETQWGPPTQLGDHTHLQTAGFAPR